MMGFDGGSGGPVAPGAPDGLIDPNKASRSAKDYLIWSISNIQEEIRRQYAGVVKAEKGEFARDSMVECVQRNVANLLVSLESLTRDYFVPGYLAARNIIFDEANKTFPGYEREFMHTGKWFHTIRPLFRHDLDRFSGLLFCYRAVQAANLANAGYGQAMKKQYDFLAALHGADLARGVDDNAFAEMVEKEESTLLTYFLFAIVKDYKEYQLYPELYGAPGALLVRCEECGEEWKAPRLVACEMCRSAANVAVVKDEEGELNYV